MFYQTFKYNTDATSHFDINVMFRAVPELLGRI